MMVRPDYTLARQQAGFKWFAGSSQSALRALAGIPIREFNLNPRMISSECRVPFGWRLGSFHYADMTSRDVEDFVYQAVADGASSVLTYLEPNLCNPAGVEKVHAFIRAGKNVKRLLDQGADRKKIGELVSESGRQKFWERWSGYKG